MTKVIYHTDEFGRVKTEQYTQTRLPDGQITLDYSEHYEKHPQRVPHHELSASESESLHVDVKPPHITVTVTSTTEDETYEQSEDNDSQTEAKEEVLTEEEKKGSICYCQKPSFWWYKCL